MLNESGYFFFYFIFMVLIRMFKRILKVSKVIILRVFLKNFGNMVSKFKIINSIYFCVSLIVGLL